MDHFETHDEHERRRGMTVLEAAIQYYTEDQADRELLIELDKLALSKGCSIGYRPGRGARAPAPTQPKVR